MESDPTLLVDAGTAFSVAGALYVISAVLAGSHVLLHKQNASAAFSWLGVIVLSPFFGVVLYWLFGINRIQRRARAERGSRVAPEVNPLDKQPDGALPSMEPPWCDLIRLGSAIHNGNYLSGNNLKPLINGDLAYPKMLESIANATTSVVLSSYIFEYDEIGKRFVAALVAAHKRGVQVRVLIDGLGVGYGFSFTKSDRMLRKQGVKTARFLTALSTSGTRFINLRNHRKILSVDGLAAFVGGMNIRAANLVNDARKHKTQDVHFFVSGPVIDQINAVFEDDWHFASGENLSLPRYRGSPCGNVVSRALIDGPDDNYQKLELTMLGAINIARHHLRIATPYFLPDRTVIDALQLAALRGVDIQLVVPKKNNLIFVDWAMRANESKLLDYGIKIFKSQPPFDHSKLFMVDDMWSLVGSSNWDSRSLELNFEINLECYDKALNTELVRVFDIKKETAQAVSQNVERTIIVRLRNNFFRLFSPYL